MTPRRLRQPETFGHLLCGHVVMVPPHIHEGDYVECWRCNVKVKVERVREASK